MTDLFAKNPNELGIKVAGSTKIGQIDSSYTGNVSLVTLPWHPYVSIASEWVPEHITKFREYAGLGSGKQGMLSAAKALVMTAIDLLAAVKE